MNLLLKNNSIYAECVVLKTTIKYILQYNNGQQVIFYFQRVLYPAMTILMNSV